MTKETKQSETNETLNYDLLIERAYQRVPEHLKHHERFEIPTVESFNQGNKTIIKNFIQLANTLRRDPEHIMKFLLGELATPGELNGRNLILGSKIPHFRINQKIEKYADEYVICNECKRPDTKIVKEKGISFLVCQACGARRPVK